MPVHDLPETRDSLMVRLKDEADAEAWAEFVEIYRPMVYRFARRRGFQDADAQDLVQRVLMAVSSRIDGWSEPGGEGRFRAWLSRVARNALIDAIRRIRPDAGRGGTSVLRKLDGNADPGDSIEVAIEREHQCEVFRWAARQVRAEVDEASWEAFWATAVLGEPVPSVAERLGRSAGAVYTARSRLMRRLREKVRRYEESWE